MKKLSFIKIVALAALVFTSCEKDSLESPDTIGAQETVEARAPLSVNLEVSNLTKRLNVNLPQNITDLRNEGISVSGGLARFVRNFDNLLAAARLSVTAEGRDRLRFFRFFESEIVELQVINRKFNDLETIINLGNQIDAGNNPLTEIPTTIAAARVVGIPISNEAESVGNLETLLTGSLNGVDRNTEIEIERLRSLFRLIEADLGTNNPDPDPDPNPNPTNPSQDVAEFIARFDIPQNIIDLINQANTFDALLETEVRLLTTNPSNIVQLGPDAFEIDQTNSQGTQTFRFVIDRNQLSARFFNQAYFNALRGTSGIDRNSAPNLNEVLKRIADRTVDALFGPL